MNRQNRGRRRSHQAMDPNEIGAKRAFIGVVNREGGEDQRGENDFHYQAGDPICAQGPSVTNVKCDQVSEHPAKDWIQNAVENAHTMKPTRWRESFGGSALAIPQGDAGEKTERKRAYNNDVRGNGKAGGPGTRGRKLVHRQVFFLQLPIFFNSSQLAVIWRRWLLTAKPSL